MRVLLSMGFLALTLSGCVDVNRGAIVQMNLKAIAPSVEGQHYELFAVIGEGAVSLSKFKVLRALEECGEDPDLIPPVTWVQMYDDGVDLETLCAVRRRMGAIDAVNLATGSLVGGVRVDTAVDLHAATEVFITVETDGTADPQPGQPAMHAALAKGVSPYKSAFRTCVEVFCADNPDSAVCVEVPGVPRKRRGILAGTFVKSPNTDFCAAQVTGEIAIVPVEDDTY